MKHKAENGGNGISGQWEKTKYLEVAKDYN